MLLRESWRDWLRLRRERLGWSLRRMSEEMDGLLSASHLGRLERGESGLGELGDAGVDGLLGVLGVVGGERDEFWVGGCGRFPPEVEMGMLGEGVRWVKAWRRVREMEGGENSSFKEGS